MAARDPLTVLRATLAALGGYYLSAAAVLVLLTPISYSLPRFGDLYYDPLVTTLAVLAAIGVFVAAAIAYSRGGFAALSVIAILAALLAASVLLPLLALGAWAWTLPADLHGLTPAAAIALSVVPAVPAVLIGRFVGARFVLGRISWVIALEAAGAYYLTGVALSLPIPQLDLRLTLPFTATFLTAVWHAAVVAVPAVVAGFVLPADWRVRRSALLGGVIGLVGAAPGEIAALLGLLGAYWPVSLAVVPVVTAAIVVMIASGRRALAGRNWPPFGFGSRPTAAALGGAAVALLAVGAWSVLATMPNSSDRSSRVESYARTGDERKIVACVISGRGEDLLGSFAREEQSTVAVTVRLRRPPSWYAHDLVGISLPVVITLRDPLGGRTVIDAPSGDMVEEVVRTEQTGFGFGC